MEHQKRIEDDEVSPEVPVIGRRGLMKAGVGTSIVAITQIPNALADLVQEAIGGSARVRSSGKRRTAGLVAETGAAWTNNVNRASGNGPMDSTSRQIVEYVSSFSESVLTDSVVESLGNVMVDAMASLIAGFESEPARICARMAQSNPAGKFKSTVLGYGVTTTPEMAAYANTSMLRHIDFNDDAMGVHVSDHIPGILAIGEALHMSGSQVLLAVTLGYELMGGLADAGGDDHGLDSWPFASVTAMAVGKLLGLNEDQLANALSLALVPRVPLRVNRVGALSMAKGCSSAPAIRDGVFSALLAREGMTGACQPFEARDGLWDRITGAFKDLNLPAAPTMSSGIFGKLDGRMCVERASFKRYPAESQTHALLEIIPQLRAWTKADDIASIRIEGYEHMMEEIADPPKWDPRNPETADHSLPYIIARAMLDGEIYLDSYTQEKITDPAVRRLMEKITFRMNRDFPRYRQRITLRTKAGGELIRNVTSARPMKHEEISAKFERACAFMHIQDEQRDRALEQWSNLRAVKDIAEPMHTLGSFGQPLPL